MDRRCLRSPHDIERNGLMRVAAKAFHFEIAKQFARVGAGAWLCPRRAFQDGSMTIPEGTPVARSDAIDRMATNFVHLVRLQPDQRRALPFI